MGRTAAFADTEILDAAATLIADAGPAAATISAISNATGASSGSIYHRFVGRNELLARVWLLKAAACQDFFARALEESDARTAAMNAALSLPAWVRGDLVGARILLLYRREDFLSGEWPAEMTTESERLGSQVRTTIRDMSKRLFGGTEKRLLRATSFAMVEMPYAAVKPHVGKNERPPVEVDELIALACGAVIDGVRSGNGKQRR
jgi:AcrR family transcriptional regulator